MSKKPISVRIAKLFRKAEECTSAKKAKKILKKSDKLQHELDDTTTNSTKP